MVIDHKLTVIIPAYNEELGIASTLEELLPEAMENEFEIIVVDDGSSDNTSMIVQRYSEIRLIRHPYNKGYGAALKTGIRNSTTQYIAFYDADGQHNPKDLLKMWQARDGYDMLVGERGNDSHVDWVRKPGKWVLSTVANFLTGRKIPDLNSGLRVIKKTSILQIIHLLPDGFSLSTTSTVAFMSLGFNVGYLGIKVVKRIGKSSVKQIRHGSNTLLLIMRLIVLFNPLKVFVPVSLVLLTVGSLYEILYGIVFIESMQILPGAILAILSGIVIFFFGLVVDQISALRIHYYDRPDSN